MKIALKFFEFNLLLFIQLIIMGDLTMSQIKNQSSNKVETIGITVLYDNYQMVKDLQTDWGFSCLVETGKIKLLFDTGESGDILLSNMTKLGIDPKNIDYVFLSHFHHDHTGGLNDFLEKNSDVTIYYPRSFPNQLIEEMKNLGATPVPVSSFQELQTNIFSLGELDGGIPEQSLAIRTPKGIVVITGCAHPGIINILEKAKSFFPNEMIYLAMGGFHLYRTTDNEIRSTISKILKMGIFAVAPCQTVFGELSTILNIQPFKEGYNEGGFVIINATKEID